RTVEAAPNANDLMLTLAQNKAEMGRLAVQSLIESSTGRARGTTYSRGFMKQVFENEKRGKGNNHNNHGRANNYRGRGYRGNGRGRGGERSGDRGGGNGRQRKNDSYVPNYHNHRRSRDRRQSASDIDDDNRSYTTGPP